MLSLDKHLQHYAAATEFACKNKKMKTIKTVTDFLNMTKSAANYAQLLAQLLMGDNKSSVFVYAPVPSSRPISTIKKFNQ
jgi:hypothetical protein